MASRYTFKFDEEARYAGILGLNTKRRAKILGTAMRLAGVYSGRSGPILSTARLEAIDGTVCMYVSRDNADLISETVERRLGQLAGLMKVHPRLIVE